MAFIDVLWYVTFCTAHISVHPCCTSAPVHPIPVHTITNGTTVHSHSTALLYLSPCSANPSPHNHERYNGLQPQHSTAVPQPLFSGSQSTQSRMVQRPTATAQHCSPAMYRTVTFQMTAVYRRQYTPSPARLQTRTAVLQCLPAVSSRPSPGPPTHCDSLQHSINLYLQDSLCYATSYTRP